MSEIQEKYVNPFTDFGFKKLFGEEPNKDLEKLREQIFDRLFEVAEIAKFTREERISYEDSLKYYRDLKNTLDTAFEEGEQKGKLEGEYAKAVQVVHKGHAAGISVPVLAQLTGLSEAEVVQVLGA